MLGHRGIDSKHACSIQVLLGQGRMDVDHVLKLSMAGMPCPTGSQGYSGCEVSEASEDVCDAEIVVLAECDFVISILTGPV